MMGVTKVKTFKYLAFLALWLIVASGANAEEQDKCLAAQIAHDDKAMAIECLLLAQHGDGDAAYKLATLYYFGYGVIQDYAEALHWMRIATQNGNLWDLTMIGSMYNEGKGVTKDLVRAHMWYNLASANGDGMGAASRDAVAGYLTQEDISNAVKMAKECMSSGYRNCGD